MNNNIKEELKKLVDLWNERSEFSYSEMLKSDNIALRGRKSGESISYYECSTELDEIINK
jgi:hypothetical protein